MCLQTGNYEAVLSTTERPADSFEAADIVLVLYRADALNGLGRVRQALGQLDLALDIYCLASSLSDDDLSEERKASLLVQYHHIAEGFMDSPVVRFQMRDKTLMRQLQVRLEVWL